MLSGKNILLGVTGGIAVYKALDLVSKLRKMNAEVDIIMTEASQEFVSELSFRTISNRPVYTDMFQRPYTFDVEHISLAERADLFIVAPATANFIGKVANGIADDLLTTTFMAYDKKVLIAPAMNDKMYASSVVQENIKKLISLGYDFVGPDSGFLACGYEGKGRMSDPDDILEKVKEYFVKSQSLSGINVTITAGPTIEEIDPVRYISNYSSGKMGYSLVEEAVKRGASVNLITGPTNLDYPSGARVYSVKSALEMQESLNALSEKTDVLIMAAAVSDYRPKDRADIKIKKDGSRDEKTLKLEENPDIVKTFAKNNPDKLIVGFAAETNDLIENARKKIKNKNLDFIIANDVSKEGSGFNTDTNIISIVDKDSKKDFPKLKKEEVAKVIIDHIEQELIRR